MGDLALQAVADGGELFSDFAQHVLILGFGYLHRLGWWALLRVLDGNAGDHIRSLAQGGGDDPSFAVLMGQRCAHCADAVGLNECLKLHVQVRRIWGELERVGLGRCCGHDVSERSEGSE
jgi:hypothetical protein